MKKQLYFILFISLFELSGNAQNLDSLYTIWQDETQADSTRSVAYYHYIRKGYVFSSPDSAIILAEALHRFAKLQDYPKAASAAYTLQGEASNLLANYPQALEYCKKSLAINEEIGDLQGSLIARKLIARMAFDHGEYISARKLYHEILELATSMGDNGIIADAHNRIGISYKRQGNYSKALAHFRKTLDVHQAIGDQVGTANGFNNIGVVYSAQGDYEKALDYFKKCLDIEEQIGKVDIITLNNVGSMYVKNDDNDRALILYQRSLSISQDGKDRNGIADSHWHIGSLYSNTGNVELAEYHFNEAFSIRVEDEDKHGSVFRKYFGTASNREEV